MRPLGLAFLVAAGCSPEPDIGSVESILGAVSPITFAATLAWASQQGEEVPCVVEGLACDTPPCAAPLVAEVGGAACPLSLGPAPGGQVLITLAAWSQDTLTFAATFGDLELGGRPPRIEEVGAATVTTLGDGRLVVAWADMDVRADLGGAEVEEGAWTVFVDLGGTPGDPSDDTLEIEGARQWVAASDRSAGVVQTAMALVAVEPSCRLEPTWGAAVIQALEGAPEKAGVDLGTVTFDDTCDGLVSFTGGGSGGFAAGKEIPLDLDR